MPIIRRSGCVSLPIVVCPVKGNSYEVCPKHVEILLITNKSLFVASSWSHLYLLIKDARSVEHKVRILIYSISNAAYAFNKRVGKLPQRYLEVIKSIT